MVGEDQTRAVLAGRLSTSASALRLGLAASLRVHQDYVRNDKEIRPLFNT